MDDGGGELVAPLRVRLLGGLDVEGLAPHDLGSRKGRTLLKVLAVVPGTPVPIDRLTEALWGDRPPARPAEQVGVLVSRLRGVLGADRIRRNDVGYLLDADWVDVAELERRVGEAAAALAEGRLGAARAAADGAVALLRGDLLPEEDGAWVEAPRAAVTAAAARAHLLAAEAAVAAGDHLGAAAAAEAALSAHPYDERALRALMRAHAAAGRPASALGAYLRTRDRVAEDLGIGLTAETEALHDRLVLAAEAPSPAASPDGFVGRDRELDRLAAALAEASAGRAQLVVLRGDAGLGKSALAETFLRRSTGAVGLRGRCDELGRDLPLQPIADAVASHLQAVGPEVAAGLVGDDAGLALLLGIAPATTATTVADAEAGRAALYASLLALVERVGADEPVVLVVDDLHLAGPGTLSWLSFAARRGRRLLLLGTTRPAGRLPTGAQVLDLGPLTMGEAERLLPGTAPERLGPIYARSAGNPLFLRALAASTDDALPETVRQAVEEQAASLPDAEAVRAAAVLGADVDLDLLAEVLEQPAVALLVPLEAAAAAGLLVERGRGFEFAHSVVREALEHGVGGARRALLHRKAATAIAARSAGDPLAVAVHARLGGADDLAVTAFERAGRDAYERFDTAAALEHLGAAVDLGGAPSVLAMRAVVLMATGRLEEAAADADAAVAAGGGARAHEVAGWVAYYRRDDAAARRHAEAGLAAAGVDVDVAGSCRILLGRILHASGDLDAAATMLGGVGDAPPGVRGVAEVWRGQVLMHQGDPDAALATIERALRPGAPLAHPYAGLHGRFARTASLGYAGRLGDAARSCDDLEGAVIAAGAVGERFVGVVANTRAWLLRQAGLHREADDLNRATLSRTSGPGGGPSTDAVSEFHYVALLDLADGRCLVGDPAGAAELAVGPLAGVDSWHGTMAWHQRHRLGLLRSRLALLDGDRDRAAELATAVVLDAAGRGSRRYELLGRARLALAGGDPGDLAAVVDGLAGCAALEGWRLLVELADGLRLDALRAEAWARAAAVVEGAGPLAAPMRAEADRVIG